MAAGSGLDSSGGAASDAAILRGIIDDLKPLLAELEADDSAFIPSEGVGPMVDMWKNFGLRLELIESERKSTR